MFDHVTFGHTLTFQGDKDDRSPLMFRSHAFVSPNNSMQAEDFYFDEPFAWNQVVLYVDCQLVPEFCVFLCINKDIK